jgi:hypothetical protein
MQVVLIPVGFCWTFHGLNEFTISSVCVLFFPVPGFFVSSDSIQLLSRFTPITDP